MQIVFQKLINGTLIQLNQQANISTYRAPTEACVAMYLMYLLADIMGIAAAFMKNRGTLIGYILIQVVPIIIGIYYADYYTTPFAIITIIIAIVLIIALGRHDSEKRTVRYMSRTIPAPLAYQEEKQTFQTEPDNEN